jgi:hypothetical protein
MGTENPPHSLNTADSQRLKDEKGRKREGVSCKTKNGKKTQSGSKLSDVLDPILRIAFIKIIRIMKELMSANSVAVGFIIVSFHNIQA